MVTGFVTIGEASEFDDGEIKAFEVEGITIAVALVEGKFYAIDDTCTHMGCSLAKGELVENIIICACHASEFDITTGVVTEGPAEDPVESYPVRVMGDDLQVEL